MKQRVVIEGHMLMDGFKPLMDRFDVIYPTSGHNFRREELLELIPSTDALLSFFTIKNDRDLLKHAKSLKIISNFGVGVDNIDVDYATSRGIVVSNTPDPVTEPTAELALGLMLSVARNISYCDRALRAQNGMKWGILENLGFTLEGKTLGIIGFGRIGQALARRAIACGMKVCYYSRNRVSSIIEEQYGASYNSLDTLLTNSDVVSLNAPLTASTRHIIGERELSLMKPTAILINSARGPLIDENALIKALSSKSIFGAGLDVYENGDGKISEKLLSIDNVVLTPHTGTQTFDTRNAMALYASQNIINFFDGVPLLSQINLL